MIADTQRTMVADNPANKELLSRELRPLHRGIRNVIGRIKVRTGFMDHQMKAFWTAVGCWAFINREILPCRGRKIPGYLQLDRYGLVTVPAFRYSAKTNAPWCSLQWNESNARRWDSNWVLKGDLKKDETPRAPKLKSSPF